MTDETTRQIAIAIGYHFWDCQSDQEAYNCGIDCAIDVAKRLIKFKEEEK